jgi:metallo-beta-lactamase family protein
MPVHLAFHGAARTVTGSCFAIEAGGRRVLVDCGLFQGSKSEKELNYRPFPFRADSVDAVLLSHAHIDHAGLLPKLVKEGFRGPVHATSGTRDLAGVMLPDSGYIQEIEVEQLNRRNRRRGRERVQPIYTAADAAACMAQFRTMSYREWFAVTPEMRARFWNAGHLLGSASIEIEARAPGDERSTRILFSADIGPDNKLLHPDPEAPRDLDYVVCEATYGDTDRADHSADRRRSMLRDEVRAAARAGGAMLVPSFAVERTQELISDLARLMREGELPTVPVYIDSPLATKATHVFAAHAGELEHGTELLQGLQSPSVRFTESVDESKALDRLRDFHIVIAASGMCEAGRIRHRLKNWLWRETATVLLVGFQAQGTLGRILQDGASAVRIQGEEIKVAARIRSIDLYSGHADGPELASWVRERLPIRHEIFLVHGEEPALAGLRTRLEPTIAPRRIVVPALDETYALTAEGARRLEPATPARIDPSRVGRMDWHNDLSRLILDINDAVANAADERTRSLIIRRIRRSLEETAEA